MVAARQQIPRAPIHNHCCHHTHIQPLNINLQNEYLLGHGQLQSHAGPAAPKKWDCPTPPAVLCLQEKTARHLHSARPVFLRARMSLLLADLAAQTSSHFLLHQKPCAKICNLRAQKRVAHNLMRSRPAGMIYIEEAESFIRLIRSLQRFFQRLATG